jgi:hypothetical protein
MANINKSFNFRNGVQVDNDNFVVNANGLVGIGTTIPTEFLDVYGNAKIAGLVTTTNLAVTGVSTFYSDVKVGSGITLSPSTGAVRATTFYGSAAGLTGFYAVATDGWYIDSGNSGIFTSFKVGIGTTNPQYSLQVGQNPSTGNGVSIDGTTGNVKTTGIITATKFSGPGDEVTSINASLIASGTLNSARLPQNISVSGIVTATTFNGSLTGTATTASTLTGTPNIIVANVTSSNINNSGIITSSNINNTGIITSSNVISGISSVGVSTVSTRLYAESIGVGTNSLASDIHIRRTSTSSLQVTSDSAEAIIAIGRSTALTGNNGALRFGNTSGIYPYSSTKSLDIINYGTGNINNYLDFGTPGIGTGNFNWFYRLNPIMSLTSGGNLGIGFTNPTVKLQVSGIASVTSLVTQSITATSNIVATGAGTSTSIQTLYVYGGKSQILNSNGTEIFPITNSDNLNLTSGISTFYDINVTNNGIFGERIGIGLTQPPLEMLHIGGNYITDPEGSVVISAAGIGIGTTSIRYGAGIDATAVDANLGIVGIGTIVPGNPNQTTLFVGRNSEFYGDISVGINTSNGLVLTSANGTKYRLIVSNTGVLSTVLVP